MVNIILLRAKSGGTNTVLHCKRVLNKIHLCLAVRNLITYFSFFSRGTKTNTSVGVFFVVFVHLGTAQHLCTFELIINTQIVLEHIYYI